MSALSLAPAGPAARPRVILVVEDHGDTADALGRLLCTEDHQAHVVRTLADAKRACGNVVFDVILCDIGLPDGSGLALARMVRRTHPRTKLIALSAYTMENDIRAARAAGFDLYLAKPIIAADLLRHLN